MFCSDPCMYIFRAYQSPASMADCGPQCAHMPNLASRNHSGISYLLKDARVPSKGPRSISIPGDGSCCAAPSFNAGSVPAISLQAVRLVILIDMVIVPPAWHGHLGRVRLASGTPVPPLLGGAPARPRGSTLS